MDMRVKCYKYIYGPVFSWRLGRSLGIDPVSRKGKICTFDCIYCQLGRTKVFSDKRKVFVSTEELIKEIKSLPALDIDYITFSGKGEPTLAKNMGDMIYEVKKIKDRKVAVITNSSLIDRKDVQEDLRKADFVMAKLDACSKELFQKVNRPMTDITFEGIIKGIREFKAAYEGKFALQIMFLDENKSYVDKISELAEDIKPDEVQINTPLRECKVRPLLKKELDKVKEYFKGVKYIYVYDVESIKVKPVSEKDTLKRRGKSN